MVVLVSYKKNEIKFLERKGKGFCLTEDFSKIDFVKNFLVFEVFFKKWFDPKSCYVLSNWEEKDIEENLFFAFGEDVKDGKTELLIVIMRGGKFGRRTSWMIMGTLVLSDIKENIKEFEKEMGMMLKEAY
jgi:hypothetical protein